VDSSDVSEIMRMRTITKVPGVRSCVEGVINLRGKVLPVMDLRKRLELKAVSDTIKFAEESLGKIDEKEAPVTTGNGNKKKAAELTDKINTKEYVVT